MDNKMIISPEAMNCVISRARFVADYLKELYCLESITREEYSKSILNLLNSIDMYQVED